MAKPPDVFVIDFRSNNDGENYGGGGHGKAGAWKGWDEVKTGRQKRQLR